MVEIEDRPAQLPVSRQRWTLFIACFSVALTIGSMAALYTALPQIATSTGATQQQLTWVVDGYTLALACAVLAGGALGDRYGRRLALVVGLVVFCLGNAIPLIVHDPAWLIAARVVSGAGAALVMPSTLSLLTAIFPTDRWGFAVGIWAGVAGSGGVAGVIASGLILRQWSWTTIFAGMTAASAVLALLAIRLPESQEHDRPRMDLAGAFTSAVTVGLFVIGITEAPLRGWSSPITLGLLVASLLTGALFVAVELRSTHPLLPMQLFANRAFSCGVFSVTLQFLINFGVFMLLMQYLQLVLGYSPLGAAIATAPIVIPMILISVVSSALTERFGLRVMTVTGLAALSVGLLLLTRAGVHTGYTEVLVSLTVASVGLGLCVAPGTSAIVTNTPPEKHGVASAVNDAAREIGAAIGIAVSGSVLAAGYHDRIQPIVPQLPAAARRPVSDSLAAALTVADNSGPSGRPLAEFARLAFVHGVQQAALVLAVILAVGAVLALAAPGPDRSRRRRWRGAKSTPPVPVPQTEPVPAPDRPSAGDR